MKSENKTKKELLKEIDELKKENAKLKAVLTSGNKHSLMRDEEKIIFNNAPIPILIINKSDKTEFVNKAFKETFGYSLKDIPDSEQWFKKAYPEKSYREKVLSSWQRVSKYKKKIVNEMRSFKVTCKNGETKDVIFRLSELKNGNYILLLDDISKRISIESELRKSEEKYRKVLENITLIGIMLDTKGKIIFCNQFFLDLTGWKQEEIKNKDWFRFFIPKNIRSKVKRIFLDAIKTQQFPKYFENEILTKSGDLKMVGWSNVLVYNTEGVIQNITSIGEDITLKLKNEYELKIRDDRFNTFISQTTDAVVCFEFKKEFFTSEPLKKQIQNIFDAILVECNDNFAKAYGYNKAKEVLGKQFYSLIDDGEGNISQLFKKFIENGYKIEGEESNEVLKDGQKKYFLNYAYGIVNKDKVKRIWVNVRDITEIKKSELALKESRERFRGLFENASVGIYRTSLYGEVLLANNAILNMLGYDSFQDITNSNVASIGYVNVEDRIYFQRIMEKFGEIKGFECEWWRKDKSIITVRESAKAIKDQNGKVLYFEGMVEDITDKKKAEMQLQKNEQRYRTLFNLSPSGIMLTDLNGNILNANPAFCESLGYTNEEIIGKNVKVIAAPETHNEIKHNLELLNKGKTLKHTVRDITKEGTFRYMDLHETKIPFNNNEYGILAVTNDITERKIFEEELIKAKERAERSDKLKTEFLAQISHEIRTPINSILSFTSYLHDELRETLLEDINNIFEIIHKAGIRITRTIDMILNMSELQTGSYEPNYRDVDLYENIIKPISAGFRRTAQTKSISFNIENKADKPVTLGDEYTLNQIFDNLINNAFKYTPSGKIKVVVGRNRGKKLYAKVSDTGIGISSEFLNQLFEPFSQEEQGYTRKFEGNGLGLALVKKYCELNNATISVKSKKGVGTTFIVQFNN